MMMIFTLLLTLILGCGEANMSPEDGASDAERAQKKMNAGDYPGAITILEPMIERDPLNYQNYTLLAAAYAGRAGVTVLDIVQAQLVDSNTNDPLIRAITKVLPLGYGDSEMEDVQRALRLLQSIPKKNRGPSGDPVYGASAATQLMIYNAVYVAMITGKFADNWGAYSPESLENLGEAEAIAIINALTDIVKEGGDGVGISSAAQSTLDDIGASPGETDEERLRNYLNGL